MPFRPPSMSPMLATTTCFTWRVRQRLLQHGGEVLQHDDRLGAGIAELEFQFARLVERVDVHHRQPARRMRGDRDRILQHVRHHDRDARAARAGRALCSQAAKRARGVVELGVGHASCPCRCRRRARRKAREAFLEQRDQRSDSATGRSRRERPADNAAARAGPCVSPACGLMSGGRGLAGSCVLRARRKGRAGSAV